MNDADIEMAQMAEQGTMIANGVCPLCTDVLDPTAPKWAKRSWGNKRDGTPYTAAEYAESLGPFDAALGYHVWCLEDR